MAIASALAALAVGLVGLGDGNAETGTATIDGIATRSVSFRVDGETGRRRILDLGGLTVYGRCENYGQQHPYLTVTATTSVDDAAASVSFDQARGGQDLAYRFRQSDFDRDYGEWDFLGTDPVNTSGTLRYTRPDGGLVALDFHAGEASARNECSFDGGAAFAEADPPAAGLTHDGDQAFAVPYAYLGVSCPESNSIACDRIGIFVATGDRPDHLIVTIAGHRVRLDDAGWRREGSAASYEGFLQSPRLLHMVPLEVAATGERWLGAPPVTVPLLIQAVDDDRGTYTEALLPGVALAAGYG